MPVRQIQESQTTATETTSVLKMVAIEVLFVTLVVGAANVCNGHSVASKSYDSIAEELGSYAGQLDVLCTQQGELAVAFDKGHDQLVEYSKAAGPKPRRHIHNHVVDYYKVENEAKVAMYNAIKEQCRKVGLEFQVVVNKTETMRVRVKELMLTEEGKLVIELKGWDMAQKCKAAPKCMQDLMLD
jgi:hypothetical protein